MEFVVEARMWILFPYRIRDSVIDIQLDFLNQRVFNSFETVKNEILTVANIKKSRDQPYLWAEVHEYKSNGLGEMIFSKIYLIRAVLCSEGEYLDLLCSTDDSYIQNRPYIGMGPGSFPVSDRAPSMLIRRSSE